MESVGIIAVAGLLVGAIVLAVSSSSPNMTGEIKSTICEITSLGQGDCGYEPVVERSAEDRLPPDECVVSASGENSSGSVAITFVQFDSGEAWIIENLGDGKSRLTRTTNAALGATAGIGLDLTITADGDQLGISASASASALLAAEEGDVFYADDEDVANTILSQQQTDDTKDFWYGDGGPVRWLADEIGGEGEYENLEPDETFSEAGIDVNGQANGTLLWGSAEAEAAVEAYMGTKSKKDGTTTDYFRGELSFNPGVNIGVAEANFDAEAESLVEVDRDEDGNPVAMRIISTTLVDGQADDAADIEDPEYTKSTIEIPLTSEADRDVASRALFAMGLPFMPGIGNGITDSDAVGSAFEIDQIAADLARVMNDRGYSSKETYTVDESENGYAVGGAFGAELGASGDWGSTEQALTSYEYWDGSGWAERPGCAA